MSSNYLLTIKEPPFGGIEIINTDFYKSSNVLLNFLFSRNATQEIISIPFDILVFGVVTKNKPVLLSIYFMLIALIYNNVNNKLNQVSSLLY